MDTGQPIANFHARMNPEAQRNAQKTGIARGWIEPSAAWCVAFGRTDFCRDTDLERMAVFLIGCERCGTFICQEVTKHELESAIFPLALKVEGDATYHYAVNHDNKACSAILDYVKLMYALHPAETVVQAGFQDILEQIVMEPLEQYESMEPLDLSIKDSP